MYFGIKAERCSNNCPFYLCHFTGGFNSHHVLTVLGSPKIIVKCSGSFRSFHFLALSAVWEQRKGKKKGAA